MSCIVLVGGVIGCGKTTFINYFRENEKYLFSKNDLSYEENSSCNVPEIKTQEKFRTVCTIILDELCSMEEQSRMMNTMKGWRNFRADLLIAAEHFVNSFCNSENVMLGPLTERSVFLLNKLEKINNACTAPTDVVFLIEDNFYYRSMRYDWFQLARRANIGFCEIFLECPLNTAIIRNSIRGYNIPEQKIRQMSAFMEHPEPEKYKWEKYSVIFDSSNNLKATSFKEVIHIIQEATNNPAELMITADKIAAQTICLKNVVHQADNIIRKLISKKVSYYQGSFQDADLKSLISDMFKIRQELLHSIKKDLVDFPKDLLENFQKYGIKCVRYEFEKAVNDLFEEMWNKKASGVKNLIETNVGFENPEFLSAVEKLKFDEL